ncbi:hypothetical protein B0T13DRAFT_247056 [Neurospora crassa]|nr:hypothetical protein B0T13DRAFT_247056 [Neurospora crassa]
MSLQVELMTRSTKDRKRAVIYIFPPHHPTRKVNLFECAPADCRSWPIPEVKRAPVAGRTVYNTASTLRAHCVPQGVVYEAWRRGSAPTGRGSRQSVKSPKTSCGPRILVRRPKFGRWIRACQPSHAAPVSGSSRSVKRRYL